MAVSLTGGDQYAVVTDNLGVTFLIDKHTRTRYRVTGLGQLAGVTALYGPAQTVDADTGGRVFLTGWTEGANVVDLFGGPGGIERVIAGQAPHPLEPLAGGERGAPTRPITIPPGGDVNPPAADEPTPEQRNAHAVISDLLDEFGLGSLVDDAWEWILEGLSETEVMQEIRKTAEYKDQFGVILERSAAGLAPMSELQVIAYRQEAARLLRAYGLPASFYDEHTDFDALLLGDIGLPELQTRIEEGFDRVAGAPVEVREAFADLFGVSGDAALAAYFLEPDEDRALSVLLEQVRAAETAGAGSMFGFDVGLGLASELAGFGFGFEDAIQGFRQAAQLQPLSVELAFERADFTEAELIGGSFGIDAQGLEALRRRQEARVAPFEAGGGALLGSQGLAAGAAR